MSEQNKQDFSNLYIPGAIVVAGVIIGVSLIIALGGGTSPLGNGGQEVAVDIEDVDIEGEPFIGDENAPVTIAYWSDFQCPYCKAVEMGHPQIPGDPALPQIITNYVDTGKVKVVFKDYAFLGPDSTTAALYENAIWELYPESHWEWREAMYEAQDEEHGGFGDEDSIVALTRTISGIDADRVKAAVAANSARYQEEADGDRNEGSSMGVQGTPGFIIGTTLIPGAVGYAQFKAAIDAQL
jgi:protein-disulfide isomerase